MDKTKFSSRETVNVKLLDFNAETKELIHIRNTKIIFEKNNLVHDIGSLAFQKRKRQKNKNGTISLKSVLVDISSLNVRREHAISNLIEEIATRVKTGQLRDISAEGKIRSVISFIDWCDINGFGQVLDDVKYGITGYREYSNYLEQRLRHNSVSLHTAVVAQENARFAISVIFSIDEDKMSQGIRRIRGNHNAANKTVPPSDNDVSEVLSVCMSFFNGAYDFLINFQKFPFKIALPSEDVWLLPSKPKFLATKEYLSSRDEWGMGQWAWNFEDGTINNYIDIAEKYNKSTLPLKISTARQMTINAKKSLDFENKNKEAPIRQRIALLANNCFNLMFFANTGMNLSQAKNLHCPETYNTSSSSIGFKSVKYRANGKEVEFVISSKFIDVFKKYIELRRYILKDFDYKYLLFTKESTKHKPNQLSACSLRQITRGLRRNFYANLNYINTRKWRANKSDFLIRTTDVATTALVLQNTEASVVRSYIEGSEQDHTNEISRYWARLDEIVNLKQSKNSGEPIAVGSCRKPNFPEVEAINSAITPDCKQPEGCLFCTHFAAHADEQDLRKLHSLSYVINECVHLAQSVEHHNAIFGQVLKRINMIVEHISSKSEDLNSLNESVKNDVFTNENLSPYWGKKLSMLVSIGAL